MITTEGVYFDEQPRGLSRECGSCSTPWTRSSGRPILKSAKRLAETIDAYSEDFADEFFWATSAQAPALLYHMLNTVDAACRPEAQSKSRPVIRLVDRKPEGS